MSFDKIAALTDRKAETYTFTEEDRAKILSNAETAGLTWAETQVEQKINYAKKLETLRKRELSLTLHASTLTEYLKTQRIPRGLRCSLAPILLKDDAEYRNKWFALNNRHSLDLMLLTVQHLQKAISEIKVEVEQTDQEFKASVTATEFNKIHEELKTNINKMREQLMVMKIKKFERDTRDYLNDKVYTWADERKYNRKTYNPRKTYGASSQESVNTDESEQRPRQKTQGGRYTKTTENKKVFLGGAEGQTTSSGEQSAQSDISTRSKTQKKKTAL